ncbi:MAG: hypothetical protein UDY71_05190 [Slackia isoflavoniconvertens]|nr:hypothetical protein [Slackia isoflavoniconvertens]
MNKNRCFLEMNSNADPLPADGLNSTVNGNIQARTDSSLSIEFKFSPWKPHINVSTTKKERAEARSLKHQMTSLR